MEPTIGDGPHTLLQLRQVTKRCARGPASRRVLDQVALTLRAGEVTCVLASRGEGKSTLLRIAGGMESPDDGQVQFKGRDLKDLPDAELSRLLGTEIAWAGTSGPGISMRMIDYVAMPLLVGRRAGLRLLRRRREQPSRGDAYERAAHALERVGALHCVKRQWESISDWERALVELAQAIASDPSLLLIDDLTDTLGIGETDDLTALIHQISRESQVGVLMGISDGQAALRCDRLLRLSAGRLIDSTPAAAGLVDGASGLPADNVIAFPQDGASTGRRERGRV